MALMATHPRDFPTIIDLEDEINSSNNNNNENNYLNGDDNNNNENEMKMKILPCLGVHPWFLHELDEDDWAMVSSSSSSECDTSASENRGSQIRIVSAIPKWIANLEDFLLEYPHVPVGEIGLDNFHFDPNTKELTTPMERQVEAFRYQLQLATKHRRPVSVHCVRAMGKIMDTLEEVATANYNALSALVSVSVSVDHPNDNENDKNEISNGLILPPRIYFHAFGGKAATATQLIKTLEKRRRIKIRKTENSKNKKFTTTIPPKLYFGFAPLVNFESPKTIEVIRTVGIDRLVLETDHEDIQKVGPSMKLGTTLISKALGVSPEELIRVTNENVKDLYYSTTTTKILL